MTDQATREAAADLIDGAIDVILEQGLSSGGFRDARGAPCVKNALGLATPVGLLESVLLESVPLWRMAESSIAAEAGLPHRVGIAEWSDSSAVEDVLLAMKRAAHSLRDGAL